MTDRTARTVTRPTSRDLVRIAACLLGARNLIADRDWAGGSDKDRADIAAGLLHLADLAEAIGSVAAAEAEREADRRESQRLDAIYETIHNRGGDL